MMRHWIQHPLKYSQVKIFSKHLTIHPKRSSPTSLTAWGNALNYDELWRTSSYYLSQNFQRLQKRRHFPNFLRKFQGGFPSRWRRTYMAFKNFIDAEKIELKYVKNWNQNSIWIIHRKKTFNSSVEKDLMNRVFIFAFDLLCASPMKAKALRFGKGRIDWKR